MINDNTRRYRVDKKQLLQILRDNQVKHVSIFNEAKAEYRRKAIEWLADQLARARDGLPFTLEATLEEPRSYARSYDDAISLLELTIDQVVEINIQDHRSLVLDEWAWKAHFTQNSASYIGEAKAGGGGYG